MRKRQGGGRSGRSGSAGRAGKAGSSGSRGRGRVVLLAGAVASVILAASFAGAAVAGPGDWPQWRGPNRDGVCPDTTPLLDAWPKEGPAKVWKSEPIAGAEAGGYGSPVIAGGKVYVYSNTRYQVDTPLRSITDFQLYRLAPSMPKLTEEQRARIDKARLSDERAGLKNPNDIGGWANKWLDANLTADEKKTLTAFVRDRLLRGKVAISFAGLDALYAAKGKEFASPDLLDKWLDEAGLNADEKKLFLAVTPTKLDRFRDELWCLSATDGKTAWHRTWDDRPHGGECSTTPAVAKGRVYFIGCDADIYCLDAADGKDVWAAKAGSGGADRLGSSILVTDTLAVAQVPAGLFAFDLAGKGKKVWEQPKAASREASPVPWTSGGHGYFLCNTPRQLHLVEAEGGTIVWSADGGEMTTPVVAGEMVVVLTPSELRAYKLSLDKPGKPLWATKITGGIRGCSPIVADGQIYVVTGVDAACYKLDDGQEQWRAEKLAPNGYPFGSPLLADGKVIGNLMDGKKQILFRATPEKFDLLAEVDLGLLACTSPTVAEGKLFVRTRGAVLCYTIAKGAGKAE